MTVPVVLASASITSRTSGVAPLSVFFDATGTTDSGTSYPQRDLLYRWSFGDTSPGNWSYGAWTTNKNMAFGPVACHVYETAGTYTWNLLVSNATTTVKRSGTITVTSADAAFPTTQTICVSITGDFTGAPTGSNNQTIASGLYNSAVAFITGTNKRLLFRAGETWTVAGAGTTIAQTGPGYIGRFGTGTNPKIQATANSSSGVISFGSGSFSIDDWRVVSVDIDGNGNNLTVGVTPSFAPVGVTQITLSGMAISNCNFAVEFSPTALSYGDQITIYQQTVTSAVSNGYGVFIGVTNFAYLGSSVNVPLAQHNGRFPYIGKGVIANNTFTGSTSDMMKLHAPLFATTLYTDSVVIRDNAFVPSSTSNWTFAIAPQNVTNDERVRNVIAESNWFLSASTTTVAAEISATSVTIRNNLFNLSGASGHNAVTITQRGVEPVPDNNAVYNNTVYSSDTASFTAITVAAGATNSLIKNNLGYAMNGTGTPTMLSDAGTGTVSATNSSDAQVKNTDPLGDGPSTVPQGFRVGTTSYAATGGTALYPSSNNDFFNCDDNTANEHIGAFIPRTRANCRGVGQ